MIKISISEKIMRQTTVKKNGNIILFLFWGLTCIYSTGYAQKVDMRNIKTGYTIPDEAYCDQPFVVKTDDGAWLCVLTTGKGNEGAYGQHIISQRSYDKGKTWVDKVDIEPADGPEASYAVLLKTPGGRIYAFYNHNTDNTRAVRGDDPPFKNGVVKKVDSQGHFVFKYSDDNGKTWSANRYDIPVRLFAIDKNNPYQGSIRYFWNVGRAFIYKGAAYVPLIKVGGFGDGFFTSSEGVLLRSDNLLKIKDMDQASWATLPDGDIGLRTPAGGEPIAEEQNFSILSDGSFFCVYRTTDGFSAYTYSRDGGHTWDPPQYMRYDNGRLIKHPRAANFAWKCENGKYLYWFHNHGGRFIKENPDRPNSSYYDRNPVWIAGGIEADSPKGKIIRWTQPEILLYDDDPIIRISYPDLVEEDGAYYLTETQKNIARLHKIDKSIFEMLWNQFDNKVKTNEGVLLNWTNHSKTATNSIKAVNLPVLCIRDEARIDKAALSTGNGFTIDIDFSAAKVKEGQILLDARDSSGLGWELRVNDQKALELMINDGQIQAVWACDQDMMPVNKNHYVSIIVDGGPKIISYVIDGVLDDGGDARQFGWGRFSPFLKTANGGKEIKIAPNFHGTINELTLYNRAINVSEAIGNYRAYMDLHSKN